MVKKNKKAKKKSTFNSAKRIIKSKYEKEHTEERKAWLEYQKEVKKIKEGKIRKARILRAKNAKIKEGKRRKAVAETNRKAKLSRDKRKREEIARIRRRLKRLEGKIKKPIKPTKKITIKLLEAPYGMGGGSNPYGGHEWEHCPKCKQKVCPKIDRLKTLYKRKLDADGNVKSEIKCDECAETFPDKGHLARHKESIHPTEFVTKLIDEWAAIDIYCREQGYPIIENEERYWIEKCCCIGKGNSDKLGLAYDNLIHLVERGLDFRAEHRYANRKYSDKPRAWMKGACLEVGHEGEDVMFAPAHWFEGKLSETDRVQGHGVMQHSKGQCGFTTKQSYVNHWKNRTHFDWRQGFYCPYCFPEKAIKVGRQVPKEIDGKANPDYPRMVGRGSNAKGWTTKSYIAMGQAFGILNEQDLNGVSDNGKGLYGIEGFGKIDDQHPIWSWIPFHIENALVAGDKATLSKLDIRQGRTRYDIWLTRIMFWKDRDSSGWGQGGQNAGDDESGDPDEKITIQTGKDADDPASFEEQETPEEKLEREARETVDKLESDEFKKAVRKEQERRKSEKEDDKK